MRVGRVLYVGISSRTSEEGVAQLAALVKPWNHDVVPVRVRGCLHLKTACSQIGGHTLLVNRAWFDLEVFRGFKIIDVDSVEPWAANVLRVGETIVAASSFPKTNETLRRAGFQVEAIDVSELMKAEAGLTCMSLIFENA